jgi:hypothetical protein
MQAKLVWVARFVSRVAMFATRQYLKGLFVAESSATNDLFRLMRSPYIPDFLSEVGDIIFLGLIVIAMPKLSDKHSTQQLSTVDSVSYLSFSLN